jgi:hypothetical protein
MKNIHKILYLTALLIAYQTTGYSQHSHLPAMNQFTSEAEAKAIISRITGVVGLKPNFQIKTGNVDNAAALVYGGKRYIIYNPVFIRQITAAVKTDWGSISILAHEVGHHLNGHTLTGKGSIPSLELEADEFSGYVLRKMGASLAEAQAAMQVLASAKDSPTHPARTKRIAAIRQGWNSAQAQIPSAIKDLPSAPADQSVGRQPRVSKDVNRETAVAYQFPKQFIAGNVVFYTMPQKQFYITTQSNFIAVDGHGYQVLGKLIKTDRSLVLKLSGNDSFTVTSQGFILNTARQRVGVIKQA